jgi:hypothetical protein
VPETPINLGDKRPNKGNAAGTSVNVMNAGIVKGIYELTTAFTENIEP